MKDDTYNGWSNYETWNWKLWLDNDQGIQERVQEIKQAEYTPDYEWETPESLQILELADELEADCEERLDFFTKEESGPFIDILNARIVRIDWREIAESLLES